MPIVIFYQEVLRCLVVIFHYVSSVIFVLTFATFIRTRWLIVSILLVGPWEIFYSTVFLVRHRYGSNAALRRLQAISMASVSWPFFHVLCFLPCTPPVLFIQTRQRIDAPKAPDLQPLGRSPAGPPGAAGASRAPAAAPMFCPTLAISCNLLQSLAILQSCNLAIVNQSRKGSFSSVSTPSFASKYSLESS